MKTTLEELLANQETIVTDGAMGTMLFQMGLEHGITPESWNVEQPEKIREVHRAYIQAGAQIILTNSFGGSRIRLDTYDLGDRTREYNEAAARVARAEADAASEPVLVAGDIGPTGRMMAPLGDLSGDEAVAVFQEQAQALLTGGADLIWIETMFDLAEVQAAVEGARAADPAIPVVTTMTFDANGHTMMGTSPEKAIEALSDLGPLAVGGNCGNGVEEIITVIEKMHSTQPDLVLIAKANAGIPRMGANDIPVYEGTPELMAAYARQAHQQGARIIGACCGSTPDHIRAISQALGA